MRPSTPSTSESPDNFSNMKLLYFSNEFPHDDLAGLARNLTILSKQRRHAHLARFLDNATGAVRGEVRLLPSSLRTEVPPFDSVFDFIEHTNLQKGELGASVDGVLLIVVQLGTLIKFYEEHPEQYDLNTGNAALAGLGLGLLSPAAVSLSPSVYDLAVAGAEAVRLAFRLGVVVNRVSSNLESRDQTSTPAFWAAVVPDVTIEEARAGLDAFHAKEKMPNTNKIFVSAWSHNLVTVSGPPSRLKHLFRSSELFRGQKIVNLPVYGGLCHAARIYNQDHIGEVVPETDSLSQLDSRNLPALTTFATSTGTRFVAETARELFGQIITEIMTKEIRWDTVVESVLAQVHTTSCSDIHVLVFRKSLPIYDLLTAFSTKQPGLEVSTLELIPTVAASLNNAADISGGSSKSKIGIVGMSYKMPGGATDTESLWDLLGKGLDDSETNRYYQTNGIGFIILNRLDDALTDNNDIFSVIPGAASNYSAEAMSITHPHAGAQSFLSRKVLNSAGIDLAGFVMNVSDAIDTKANYSVTRGWSSMRFAKSLIAGAKYQSYVKMIPTVEYRTVHLGDAYILQDNEIFGLVGGIKFWQYPRILLNRFFSAPDEASTSSNTTHGATTNVQASPKTSLLSVNDQRPIANSAQISTLAKAGPQVTIQPVAVIDPSPAPVVVAISGSLFLEYPTIGDVRSWMMEYYG
ncbi:putative Non-reducing polyketide synthase 8 [Seiridium unicorne]|uniref:Non-reducing polyketide synthase 8 n=1 Tax=Seiridium unicorne TaxID=138068 RepID=A0ABR2VGK5_9PEZI